MLNDQILQCNEINMLFERSVVKLFKHITTTVCSFDILEFQGTYHDNKWHRPFSLFCWVICMFPGFSCFVKSARNELDDNIQIYVHIILECLVQVTSRCNTSEAPSWQCHDVNWSLMQCLSCLLVRVILSSDMEQKFESFHPKAIRVLRCAL